MQTPASAVRSGCLTPHGFTIHLGLSEQPLMLESHPLARILRESGDTELAKKLVQVYWLHRAKQTDLTSETTQVGVEPALSGSGSSVAHEAKLSSEAAAVDKGEMAYQMRVNSVMVVDSNIADVSYRIVPISYPHS
jgi:hypothetical protein